MVETLVEALVQLFVVVETVRPGKFVNPYIAIGSFVFCDAGTNCIACDAPVPGTCARPKNAICSIACSIDRRALSALRVSSGMPAMRALRRSWIEYE